ncbi:suppressor of Mek1-like isoform X1 [Fagus crenata]
MESCNRPNRSDIHLTLEEEAKLEAKTREFFDESAPKRHTKPQRSEYSSQYVDALSPSNNNNNEDSIPELLQFQRLENDPQKLIYNGSEVTEEFVETEYYKDLNCVDKKHHTTGTGFIKMEDTNDQCFHLAPDSDTSCHTSCQCNPATNDWIPASANMVTRASDKPNRSDS